MDNDDKLLSFCEDFKQKINYSSELEDEEKFKVNCFTELMLEYLVEAEEIEDAHVFQHKAKGIQVNGYYLNENNDSLDILVSIYTGITPPEKLTKADVTSTVKRAVNFISKSLKKYYLELEESTEAFDLSKLIHDIKDDLNYIRIFLLTDQRINKENISFNESISEIDIQLIVWDIEKCYKYATSGQLREKIELDLESEFNKTVECLKITMSKGDYTSYLMFMPGELLMNIYDKYGSRLLERNVRSYLQAKGAVNKGIKNTIAKEPQMFLAYNNGISATAENVEIINNKSGGISIKAITDLQIVNGGQTTASIYAAAKKDKKEISDVYVQVKLTVLSDASKMDDVVPRISEYANSQNKVQIADFSANDPFHRKIEELSRSIWAPSKNGTQNNTRWFYERARGQYNDARGKNLTPTRVKAFEKECSPKQVFTKTDLAKFENTWNQLPHLVSKGAQTNFKDFTIKLKNRGNFIPDEKYFQHLIAKAIIFKRTEKLVSEQKFGGYRANIVTYSLAWIFNKCAQRIDLDRIWKQQDISQALEKMIIYTSKLVYEYIVESANGANVTQWCKKETCWKRLQEKELKVSSELQNELIQYGNYKSIQENSSIDVASEEEKQVIDEVMKISDSEWYNILSWAKETGNLQKWQLSLIVSLGKLAKYEKLPSRKQAVQGKKIIDEIKLLGYNLEDKIS